GLDAKARVNVNNVFDTQYIAEATDRIRTDESYDELLDNTRGWFGFGRTWNTSLKLYF
ncbi:MAG: hypothetical protein HKN79_01835, partial [Flavobacteriales bacterium]|nr:hypothetical protein [Flavobacteriales bacterium]